MRRPPPPPPAPPPRRRPPPLTPASPLPIDSSSGARGGTVAVAFLDVHRSLPYLQRQMETRNFADCDLYTFVKFSLLNCLVTDPSVHSDNPALRNPIVFASAGFAAMCGCSQEEVLHRNCRFLQSPQFLEAPPPVATAAERKAVALMSAALDAREESITCVLNYRKDGSRFVNLLFMTPIRAPAGGVLFWVGVQHPVDEAHPSMRTAEAATGLENEVASQVRSLHQSLQALQLQELYGGHLAASQRTAIVIQKVAQEGAPTCVCRLCENLVLVESLQAHTQQCKVFTQCKTLASCSDANLSRVLAKLNATATAAHVFGTSGTQASTLLELLRSFCSVLLSLTAASHILPQLAGLLHKLDQLLTASNTNKHPAMEACWADVKAAGQRKLLVLQNATMWALELQQTVAHVSGADPLARGQAPCLQDFEPVRELQRGSHAAVVMVKKRQTDDVFAMKVADRTRLGRGAPPTHTHPQSHTPLTPRCSLHR